MLDLTELMEERGHDVRSAETLVVARSLLRTWPPDVLLVTFSVLDSAEAAEELRAQQPSIRCVVGITNQPRTHTAPGCDVVICRPFDPDAMLRAIEQFLACGTRA